MIALIAFVALSFLRFVVFQSETFLYLIWNVFLAYIPFLISAVILNFEGRGVSGKIFIVLGGVVWLLFFPNAPYVITDFIHLSAYSIAPLWYDALLLGAAAITGVLFGIYSLFNIEKLLCRYFSKKTTWAFLILAMLFSSFGIYLGRFLRWNTWDVLLNPLEIMQDVWIFILHPIKNMHEYIFISLFFFFILGSFLGWRFLRERAQVS